MSDYKTRAKESKSANCGVPINSVTARVIAPGYQYVPTNNRVDGETESPPPTWVPPNMRREHNLAGRRFGRGMTVLGLSIKGARWVVRCACGIYVFRSAKAIKNENNDADCCSDCRHQVYLKRDEYWRRTGRERPSKDFT